MSKKFRNFRVKYRYNNMSEKFCNFRVKHQELSLDLKTLPIISPLKISVNAQTDS